ncbi:hypothetical protein J7U46_20875 [Pelomonas sp. V22]|uniref:hypothetical protein n=1 Tax=Pelomonas sp. V22 TaxID=2822139 RepID=UPI0024A9330F|nr:hypothetical protein [Pelomonas sp. V22]MDI4635530.1 hypothetical protein [Pelomonas sp. V22]
MKAALHPIVNAEVARLTEEQLEAWEERSAILEFEGGHARDFAEALALILIFRELINSDVPRTTE